MTGKMVGYARVSTTDQDLTIQLTALEKAGCDPVFSEKRSGTSTDKRVELARCLQYLRDGDTLVVAKVDRLGRSLVDLAKIVDGLQQRGVKFLSLDQNFDVETPGGKAMLQMLMVFAELENSFRRQRQSEGIAAAKARGVYDNRRTQQMRSRRAYGKRLLEQGMTYQEAADKCGLHRYTLYRHYPEFRREEMPEEEVRKRVDGRKKRKVEREEAELEKTIRAARKAEKKVAAPVVSPEPPPPLPPAKKTLWGKLFPSTPGS